MRKYRENRKLKLKIKKEQIELMSLLSGFSTKAIKDNILPKPIQKGLQRFERIGKRGLVYKVTNHKLSQLPSNLGKGINRSVVVAKAFNDKDKPFQHLNLNKVIGVLRTP